MKNVYLFQPNYKYGKSAHLPYAVGVLAAYAWSIPEIKSEYLLKKIFFLRENAEAVLETLDNPHVIGFSTYLWNIEYNLAMAKLIKQHYPSCLIVFGGHQISPDGSLLNEAPFIDVVIHSEGERSFAGILCACLKDRDFSSIPNLSFRQNGQIVSTPRESNIDCCEFPSPYLSGVFDPIIEENPDVEFQMLFETNRGCAYRCAYCDWGCLKSKLRLFPMERIYGELDWMVKNKLEFCGNADANFGVLARDEQIIDHIIELKRQTGFPKKFQASYAKNSDDRIFEISRKLQNSSMNKGVTLAFQTMSTEAARLVGRDNISISRFTELMEKYNRAGIPTYTELILGLPGETYDSFVGGIDRLLRAGQHNAIYIHNCELLPCSEMGSEAYVNQYKIKATEVFLNQPHMPLPGSDDIPEFSHIVTETFSMSKEDWVRLNLFSCAVQCFHHLGVLQCIAVYCCNGTEVEYSSFYKSLIEFLLERPETVGGRVLAEINSALNGILNSCGYLTVYDERFGNVMWPFEEYMFLSIAFESGAFYAEIAQFVEQYIGDRHLRESILRYQQDMLRLPSKQEALYSYDYDFPLFFENAFAGKASALVEKKISVRLRLRENYSSWEDFSRYIVWYGRKDRKNIYTDEIEYSEVTS